MKILGNGYFSDEWGSDVLSKGVRQTSNSVRNQKVLTYANGMVGQDGLLSTIPTLSRSSLSSSGLVPQDDFPFPQIFTLEKFIIVCNRTTILEIVSGALTLKATVIGGETWSIASSHDFLYLSNGAVNLVRNPENGEYVANPNVPICSTILNYNGQIICGNIR